MKHLEVSYTVWKQIADKYNTWSVFHYHNSFDGYFISTGHSELVFEAFASQGADLSDFINNYLSRSSLIVNRSDAIALLFVTEMSDEVTLIDEAPNQITYIGKAAPAVATSEAKWQIFRLDESGSGDENVIKLYANNSVGFDQIWDNRASLSYNLPA